MAQIHELIQVLIGHTAGGQHQPDVARCRELLDQVLERGGADTAVFDCFLDRAGAAVECHYLVSAKRQAVNHVAAHAAEPNDPDLLFYLGQASRVLLQKSFDRLMRADPTSPRAHQLMAETYLAQRQVEAAEREYRKALEIRPSLRGIHLALGTLKMKAGNLDEAEKEFRAETALSPGDGEAAWRLGSVLLQKGRTVDALAELERSDKLRPRMIETLFDLAKAYHLQNKMAEAEKAWLSVIALDDTGELAASSHFQLSQRYRRQGNAADADRHLRRFQQLQPKAP